MTMDGIHRALGRIESGRIDLLDGDDLAIIRSVLTEASEVGGSLGRAAAWLREKAELALHATHAEDQPEHAKFVQGWRQGAYNALYVAASHVESGNASATGSTRTEDTTMTSDEETPQC